MGAVETIAVTKLTNRMRYSKTSANSYKVEYATNAGTTKTLVELTRPSKLFFEKQLGFMQSWAELRDERGAEILTQIDNQFAFIAAATGLNIAPKEVHDRVADGGGAIHDRGRADVQARICVLSPGRSLAASAADHFHARPWNLPDGPCGAGVATIVALSGLLGVHRPVDVGGTPPAPHPAYTQLRLQARRFSVNRVIAGMHFPIDAPAGQILGTTLGEVFLRRCNVAVPCKERSFAPTLAGDAATNDYLGEGPDIPNGGALGGTVTGITSSSYLERLTELAQAEWDL